MLHSTLVRQLRKAGASKDSPPALEPWQALLDRVSAAYVQDDQERYTIERAIAISSKEMAALNANLATERDGLRATIASMADGLCLLSEEGLVEIANRAAEELLGAQSGELVGKDFVAIVSGNWPPEKERRSTIRQLRLAIGSKASCRSDDARFMKLKRESLPVSFALTQIDGSRSGRSVVLFSDIRVRKASEDALRESESIFRAIFESSGLGIVRLGIDSRIVHCNKAFSSMLGHEPESLLGKSIFAFIEPQEVESARERFGIVMADAATVSQGMERHYVHRDGSTIWTKQTVSFVRNRASEPLFGIAVVENVTAQRNLEVSLLHAQKLESIGQLASGIAHEINTPVQFVSDSVHFARDAVRDLFGVLQSYRALRDAAAPSLPEMAAEAAAAEDSADVEYLATQLPKALDRALDGLQRVATIVRGMKEFAHPDQRDKSLSDLNRAIETTITIARNEYKYVADVETEFGDLPPMMCHVGELNQVFLNIIVNAAHAIGDVVRDTNTRGCIRIKTWRDGGFVVVSIRDSGGGIPEAVRHRIFDPFFTTKEVGRGTGQGLAIARAVVVEKHQGELTFQTHLGQGTTFTIRLPIDPPATGRVA